MARGCLTDGITIYIGWLNDGVHYISRRIVDVEEYVLALALLAYDGLDNVTLKELGLSSVKVTEDNIPENIIPENRPNPSAQPSGPSYHGMTTRSRSRQEGKSFKNTRQDSGQDNFHEAESVMSGSSAHSSCKSVTSEDIHYTQLIQQQFELFTGIKLISEGWLRDHEQTMTIEKWKSRILYENEFYKTYRPATA
jgi:hypothetical protein